MLSHKFINKKHHVLKYCIQMLSEKDFCLSEIRMISEVFSNLLIFNQKNWVAYKKKYVCKFASLKKPFATITSLSELSFTFKRFITLVQMKKVISMNYGSSTTSWKLWTWVRLDLILMMKDIYIYIYIYTHKFLHELTKFTSSSRSMELEFKDILPWNIPQMITKTIIIGTKIVISYVMKRCIPFWVWWKVNGNWDSNMIRIF